MRWHRKETRRSGNEFESSNATGNSERETGDQGTAIENRDFVSYCQRGRGDPRKNRSNPRWQGRQLDCSIRRLLQDEGFAVHSIGLPFLPSAEQ